MSPRKSSHAQAFGWDIESSNDGRVSADSEEAPQTFGWGIESTFGARIGALQHSPFLTVTVSRLSAGTNWGVCLLPSPMMQQVSKSLTRKVQQVQQ